MIESLPEPKLVKEWLYDYWSTIEGTQMAEILETVGTREVASFAEARSHVNTRIDLMISWMDGIRPVPSLVYEHEAWQEWIAEKKAREEKLKAPPAPPPSPAKDVKVQWTRVRAGLYHALVPGFAYYVEQGKGVWHGGRQGEEPIANCPTAHAAKIWMSTLARGGIPGTPEFEINQRQE